MGALNLAGASFKLELDGVSLALLACKKSMRDRCFHAAFS